MNESAHSKANVSSASSSNVSEFPVQFVRVEPYYKHILRGPFEKVRARWNGQDAEASNQQDFGPPYVSNRALEEALVEELRDSNISLESIRACLTRKIDPNIPDKENNNCRPLHYAAKYGNIKLMLLLLRAGACVDRANALGQTPLMIACQGMTHRHNACVDLLLSFGCNMELKDRGGSNALRQSILASNTASVKTLLDHGARLNWNRGTLFEQPDGSTALNLAENVRAKAMSLDVLASNKLYEELEARGPTSWDRLKKIRLCAPSNVVVDLIKQRGSSTYSLDEPILDETEGRREKIGFIGRLSGVLKNTNNGLVSRRKSAGTRALHVNTAQPEQIDGEGRKHTSLSRRKDEDEKQYFSFEDISSPQASSPSKDQRSRLTAAKRIERRNTMTRRNRSSIART